MERATENKIVLITQKTRLEMLIRRYNTKDQAQFFIEHGGGDFSDYVAEHDRYTAAVRQVTAILEMYGRVQRLDRDYLTGYIFGENDLVIALGRDGLVANTLKYLDTQQLVGVNPDPSRWDGVLLPFSAADLKKIVPEVFSGRRDTKTVTIAEAALSDGQTLFAVNDLFIGQKTHVSARYIIDIGGRAEEQSSSGMIISTGLGSTGWLSSVIAGAAGVDRGCGLNTVPVLPEGFNCSSRYLYYTVREPFASRTTGTDLVFGRVEKDTPLTVTSLMPENGVIFSDGVEQDSLEFNSGARVTVSLADRTGRLVI